VISFECNNCFNLIFKIEITMFNAIFRSLYWVFPLFNIFRTSIVPFNTNNSIISLFSFSLSPFHALVCTCLPFIVSQRTHREEKGDEDGKPNSSITPGPLEEEPD